MQTRAYLQIDVFGSAGGFGNPLAVVLDGNGLSDADMLRFAQWTNLSETTFLLPPTYPSADYRVRIFTPGGELPFAGHPTLGSCHAWLAAGGRPMDATCNQVVQQCEVGLVPLRRTVRQGAEQWAFAAPPLKRSAPSPSTLAQIATALGLRQQQVVAAQILDNGPVWLGLLLDSVQTVLALNPDHSRLKHLGLKVGVAAVSRTFTAIDSVANKHATVAGLAIGSAPRSTGSANAAISATSDVSTASDGSHLSHTARADRADAAPPDPAMDATQLTVRAFAAATGIAEDPVTGSLNASLAQWLISDGVLPSQYAAEQGERLGRAGRVNITRDEQGQVWVGGSCMAVVEGVVRL